MVSASGASREQPFIEHVHELRNRLLICLVVIALMGIIGYVLNGRLIELIQRPLGQKLYYTSPTGGFSFVFKLCIFFGLVCALPAIVFHLVKFLSPALKSITTRKVLSKYMAWSVILAASGIIFAYSLSLPAALHFLANFGGHNIQSIITADEYFNFAIAYIAGFAVLFQLPLLIIFINRIRPWKPRQLWRLQRYVIITSFIAAAVITPTPDPFNQLLMALPVIVLYQIAAVLVWGINVKHSPRQSSKSEDSLLAAVKITNASANLDISPSPKITRSSSHNNMGIKQKPKLISDFRVQPVPSQSLRASSASMKGIFKGTHHSNN